MFMLYYSSLGEVERYVIDFTKKLSQHIVQTMEERPAVKQCSEAVVDHYGVTFTCLGSSLEKLNTKQEILAVRVSQGGEKLNDERAKHKVEQMISITNIYRNKLVKIREDMQSVTERSVRLRQRAGRLQDEKQRESMERENRKETERLREKELIAKPSQNINM